MSSLAEEPPRGRRPGSTDANRRLRPRTIAGGITAPSWLDEPLPPTRRLPLRFMWQMDQEGRFSLGSDEFSRLIGPRTAAGFGRLWSEIAATFGLDPDGRVMKAFATRATWSGITLDWPVDGGGRLPVELSGLPVFETRGILPAIAVSAFAAISTAWRGSPRCAAKNSSARRRRRSRCRLTSCRPVRPKIRPPKNCRQTTWPPTTLNAGIARSRIATEDLPAEDLLQEILPERTVPREQPRKA